MKTKRKILRKTRRNKKRKLDNKQKKVLLIAIDGFRPDTLKKSAKNMYDFAKENIYTFSCKVSIPISATSWTTIFTGLSSKKTGVTTNAFTGDKLSIRENNLRNKKVKPIFTLLKDNKIKSLVVSAGSWDGIYKIANWSGIKDNNNIQVTNKPPFSIYAESISEKKGLEKMIKKINEN